MASPKRPLPDRSRSPWLARLACRIRGHRWGRFGDNGCYSLHYGPGGTTTEHWHWFTSFCGRCSRIRSIEVERIGYSGDRPVFDWEGAGRG